MIKKAKIKTSSPKFKVIDKGEYLEIHLKSPPQEGKANLELIKEMTKKYGYCKIIRGKTSKNKILEIK